MSRFKLTKKQSYPFCGAARYRLRSGVTLNVSLTFRCYLDEKTCPECSMLFWGKLKNPKESSLEDWKRYFETFPKKVKEIYLSGGSPEMLPCFVTLCDWILDEGYLLKVFTNLSVRDVLLVEKSSNFSVQATYHHGASKERFLSNYEAVRKKHWVDVDEIGYAVLPFSRVKPCSKPDDLKNAGYIVSPDRNTYGSCHKMYNSNLA